ncbi:TPA: hypothetical protein ACP3ZG_004833 [Pseudomonas aeruginosa]|uniref:hypothetical protein n=1 Tax=Pseudomonas TaxID=286 RepID=UPI0011473637|nr:MULTISPECIES: hypothetical protein [Pseudomonas]ELG7182271.1 hypothetical protein [Pseudomonas aeruginosa]MBH4095130.1 hypothetical protein [Pseudomonas aeruginosa]MBI6603221.1 hypothetical protein [Pseudomonas sp. S4_EA_1b]MBI8852350.1 hypothetical protein [Pseudomonas aeruginosa]HCF9659951.1 hypothetical protein [Pseudomonas aeruginosa]
MPQLTYPRARSEVAAELARDILQGRFISDHKDYNRMLAAVRERGMPVEHAFCGESAALSISVVEAIAEENLRNAPLRALERKINRLDIKKRPPVKADSRFLRTQLTSPFEAKQLESWWLYPLSSPRLRGKVTGCALATQRVVNFS